MAPSLPDSPPEGPTSSVVVDQSIDEVFDVLLDPTTYPDWLVGADRVRAVDDGWPAPGTAFHHTVGVGPLKVSDKTTVVSVDRPHRLELMAHVGPVMTARVTFELASRPEGGTSVAIHERPERGVAAAAWQWFGRRVLAAGIWGRNAVALDRLRSYLAARPA
jgi:uncharacterized protein YndB with AHSA1/START domain